MPELPFSVKPEKKLSVQDVLAIYRDPYEGTDFDMAKNLLVPKRQMMRRDQAPPANPPAAPEMVPSPIASAWMPRDVMTLANALKPGTIRMTRTIPISGCSYATVIQVRGWLPPSVGAVCWFAFDNPAMSPRVPIFAGTTDIPAAFKICGQHRYRMDSADWIFRRTNRLATLKWGATKAEMMKNLAEFEDKAFADLPALDKKVQDILGAQKGKPDKKLAAAYQVLTNYTNDFARETMKKSLELGDKYWMLFAMSL
ncbi:MAG: C69 family dipeptidase [Acidobacteriota bacterium]